MQVSMENTGELSRKMSITVPADEVTKMATSKLEEVQKTYKMQGFRPGKVPMDVIKSKFGASVMGEITEQLISSSMVKAFGEKKVNLAGQPKMEEGGLPEEGKDYTFTVAFEVYPEIDPKGFEGLKLTRETSKPTDKMVETMLKRLADVRKSYADKDGVAEKGDRIVLDGHGYKKGEDTPFEGGHLHDFSVELGAGQMIPGFEEALMGLKKGDQKEFEVTFPKEYHSQELAGQPARFDVKILAVQTAEAVKMDDEFAKMFGEETLDGLKEKVKEQLQRDLDSASEQRMKREMFDQLDKANQFNIPEGMIENEFKAIWDSQMRDLQQRGLSIKDLDKPEDELKKEYRELAGRRVRLGLVIAEIGKLKELKVDQKDINAEIDRVAATMPGQEDAVRQYYSQPQAQNEIAGPLFERKVTEWIVSNAKVTDKEIDADKLLEELGPDFS